jgi:hypothetical protein
MKSRIIKRFLTLGLIIPEDGIILSKHVGESENHDELDQKVQLYYIFSLY